jgi:membrane protease YdiL (CAAX protease family)
MKNAIISGSIIGVLTALWLFLINWLGYNTTNDHLAPIAYASFIIPLAGIFIGVWRYKINVEKNEISFFAALFQSLKILLTAGLVAGFLAIIYTSLISKQVNLLYVSGRLFGALLVGILICFGVALTLMNKSAKID